MEFLENLDPAIMAGALGALVFLFVLNKRLGRKREPDWVQKVREQFALGNYEQAGLIQQRHGNLVEALNLFEQGGIHRRAWPLASRLGQMERAAKHAERACEYDHAAGFYQQAGNLADAIRILEVGGRFLQAAVLLEQKGGVPPYEMGRAWEKAYNALVPEGGEEPSSYTIDRLKKAATMAARAFKRAGRRRNSDTFVERAQKLGVEDVFGEDVSEPIAPELGLAPAKGLADPSPRPLNKPVPEAEVPVFSGNLEILSTRAEQTEDSILDLDDVVAGTQTAVSSSEEPAVESAAALLASDIVFSDESMRALESLVTLEPQASRSGDDRDLVDDETAAALQELGDVKRAPHSEPPEKKDGEKTAAIDDQPVARIEVVHIVKETRAPQPQAESDVVQVHDHATNMATAVRIESDRYVIGEKIGEGGMAVVFEALDRNLDREVALKFLPRDVAGNPRAQKLFKKEAQSVARLNHPNIVTIFDFGVLDERPFICMELIRGGSLNEILKPMKARGLPLPEALDATEGLLSALEYAHGKKIVHRDIKPHNIMRTGLGTIKLMDFGIAKVLDTKKTTIVAGTPAYMAPEQMTGRGIDRRTDLFALGVTVYEMLTGFLPFKGMRRERAPAPLSKLRHNIPQGLDELVLACCELKKDDRPGSAAEVLSAIKVLRRKHPILNDDGDSTPDPGFATPRLSEVDSDTARDLLDQFTEADDVPEDALWPLYSAALNDERASIRKSAIDLYPGEITGRISKSLVELMADDVDDSIREAAQKRLERDGSKLELISPLAETLDRNLLEPMPSEKRQALFRSIVDLTGADSLKVFEEVFDAPNSEDGETEQDPQDDADLDDLISAVSGEEEEVRERFEQAALVWRNKRRTRKTNRQAPPLGEKKAAPTGILKPAEKGHRKDECDSLPPVVAEMLTEYLDKS